MEKKYKDEVVKAVTEQVINMLSNNVLYEHGTEGFLGWIADGEVFDFEDNEDFLSAMELAQDISTIVDNLTYYHLNLGY